MTFAFVVIVVISYQHEPRPTHDSMYECKDGKCYPKNKPDVKLGK
jgi:hypothetical protein